MSLLVQVFFLVNQTQIVSLDKEQHSVRSSSRPSKLPAKLNDFVIDSKLRFGIKKHVNYANLNFVNYFFSTTLNKYVEYVTYQEAIKDNNIGAMNNEIKALNKNNTWTVTDLPVDINALLYHDLSEEVYMSLPLGFDRTSQSQVCMLNKSLYGLKQALRQRNGKLTTALVDHGFKQTKHDYSLYIKQTGNMFIALLVYVDDT
ncbi:ribonuclease H-like domain-containing protein, partial [Tanacetum coccineum]